MRKLDEDLRGVPALPPTHFTLSRELRLKYKSPPAHKQLAERMRARDPGSAPQVNERVQYAFVYKGGKTPRLQADRIEDIATIEREGLEIDHIHYYEETFRLIDEVLALVPGARTVSLDRYVKPILHERLTRTQRLVTDFFPRVKSLNK